MTPPDPPAPPHKTPSLLENWISLAGIILAAGALFAVAALIAIDTFSDTHSPYMGILTYLVAPGFLVVGLVLMAGGALWERRRRHHLAPGAIPRHPVLDFNVPRQRNTFVTLSILAFIFLLATAFGAYRTYHVTESVSFCGQTCHQVMAPEFTAYQNSPHARVTCVQCHIGPGAGWFVRSKLSGAYQVYAVLADVYPRPIPTPIENLRPAQETCEQCHWPRKFFGNAERVNRHYFSDSANTPWTIRLLMRIGGGSPEMGPVGGIHWHMNIANTVEYIATDTARQVIPWVRVTDPAGNVTVYRSTSDPLTPEQVDSATPRRMDCVDCHNRPAHQYHAPTRAVSLAMSTGRISPSLPWIKRNATALLTAEYASTDEALDSIRGTLEREFASWPDGDAVSQAVTELQRIYQSNFFPEMKVQWRAYPNNVGHTLFPGCYRCHDGDHQAPDGRVITHECTTCHTIIAQGTGADLETVSPQGLEFRHPIDIGEAWRVINCAECHTGG